MKKIKGSVTVGNELIVLITIITSAKETVSTKVEITTKSPCLLLSRVMVHEQGDLLFAQFDTSQEQHKVGRTK